MKIHIEQLESLCVLEEPILLNTKDPIIDKDTIIDEKLIKILKRFRIEEIEVRQFLSNGKKFLPKQLNEDELLPYLDLKIKSVFKKALLNYKEVFMVVQSQGIPNLKKIDESIVELFKVIIETKKEFALLLYRICEEDDYIYNYAICTSVLAGYLSYESKRDLSEAIKVCRAGLLSNVGLSKINGKTIRLKRNLLQDELKEWDKHALYGYQVVSNLPGVDLFAKNIIIQHEELLDGTGSPLRLRADKICTGARIVGIAEAYYKYMCPNPFFISKTPFSIIRDMQKKDVSKYDQSIVKVLARGFNDAFEGAPVKLSNKEVGQIIKIKDNLDITIMINKTEKEQVVTAISKLQIESCL